MKYFKIMQNKTIIGVITSNDFMHYITRSKRFSRTNEENGEYVIFQNQFYRSSWMAPIVFNMDYILADIIEINEAEYLILKKTLEENETIEDDTQPDVIPTPDWHDDDTVEQHTLDFIRSSKLTELSRACRTAIESGIDLELHGETHHFSLTTQDQLNLMSLSATARTQDLIPYHADGELYTYYTAEEINSIIKAANDHKVYHTAYYNSLKAYVNALTTIEEIAAVTYGTEVPDEYKSDVLRVLE